MTNLSAELIQSIAVLNQLGIDASLMGYPISRYQNTKPVMPRTHTRWELTQQTIKMLEPFHQYLQQEYQERLVKVVLFGSHSRGEATSESDIDILIVLKDLASASQEIEHISHFTSEFCLTHNCLLSPLFMSKSKFETENSPLLRNVRNDGIGL